MRYLLNIGLEVSPARLADTYGADRLIPSHALAVLRATLPLGALVVRAQRLPANAQSEPTLVVHVYVPGYMPDSRWHDVADALYQDAIAVVPFTAEPRERPDWKRGGLYGPRAEEWGPFNRDYFRIFED